MLKLIARPIAAVLFIAVVLAIGGCSSEVAPATIASSQAAFEEAKQLAASGSYAAGLPLIEQALAGTGLNADQYASALLVRAQCLADAGEFEKADADLNEAQMGDPDPAFFQLSKGIVLSKQGKEAEAKKAFAMAKRLDSKIQIP